MNINQNSFKWVCAFISISAFGAEAPKDLNWSGDFRFRHEYISQENPAVGSNSSYHQQRIRARLGLAPAINDQVTTEFRLSTAPGRTGTNQTLGASSSGFSNYTITLDRAGFKYSPNEFYSLMGGRLGNPYFEPGDSDLIWDTDLNFDGLSLALKHSCHSFQFFLNSNFYWVDKSTTAGAEDVTLKSAQLGARQKVSDDTSWTAGLAVHHFSNLQGHALISSPTAPAGNSTTGTTAASKKYANSFNLIDPGVELKTMAMSLPLSVFANYVVNTNTESNNTGYLAGVKVGKLKTQGDFSFAYDYRLLKKDAAVASFTDADSFGGGTNGRSHRVSMGYQIAQNWSGSLTGYLGQAGISSGETAVKRNKVHLDLVFKF